MFNNTTISTIIEVIANGMFFKKLTILTIIFNTFKFDSCLYI